MRTFIFTQIRRIDTKELRHIIFLYAVFEVSLPVWYAYHSLRNAVVWYYREKFNNYINEKYAFLPTEHAAEVQFKTKMYIMHAVL